MAICKILTVPNPVLKQVSALVAQVDDRTRTLMDDMLETMYASAGIGLAAIQLGIAQRVIVMDLDQGERPRYFVNPEIVERTETTMPNEEGCLSVPDVFDTVERPDRVFLRYLNYDGAQIEEWAEGLFAVCIQHEMDHLDGILFIDHLSRLKRERAVEKVRKSRRLAEKTP